MSPSQKQWHPLPGAQHRPQDSHGGARVISAGSWHRLRPFRSLIILLLSLIALTGVARGECPPGATATLPSVKGLGSQSLPPGHRVTVEGTVSAVFPAPFGLGGFYIQHAGPAGQPPVGLFVYLGRRGGSELPRAKERVLISGYTGRYRGHIQLERVVRITSCGADRTLRPWPLHLPARTSLLRRLEDVYVRPTDELTVTDNYQLAHYGTLGLAVGGRLFQPGNGTPAVAGTPAGVLLDDGSYHTDPRPVPYLGDEGTRRLGSRLADLSGILTRAFGQWRIQPATHPRFQNTNPRQVQAPARKGSLRIASFNLENYFLTQGSRGAASESAFRRQQRKLVAAIDRLDADVLALHEVENRRRAVASLLHALNAGSPTGSGYLAAAAGMDHGDGVIRTVLLYRTQRLRPRHVWINENPVFTRPPVAASFQRLGGKGSDFAVVAVHLKSKHGCPRHSGPERGPGCWAALRRRQAVALEQWLERLESEAGHRRFLLVGDLNSYVEEDAVQVLLHSGLRNLIAEYLRPADRYTYVYRGYAGYLDHALATVSLADSVRQVAIWHINADEPNDLGYRNPKAAPGPFRSSDHDPVLVDLR